MPVQSVPHRCNDRFYFGSYRTLRHGVLNERGSDDSGSDSGSSGCTAASSQSGGDATYCLYASSTGKEDARFLAFIEDALVMNVLHSEGVEGEHVEWAQRLLRWALAPHVGTPASEIAFAWDSQHADCLIAFDTSGKGRRRFLMIPHKC